MYTYHFMFHAGTVKISPPEIASVCSGDQLELMCNATGSLLEWNLFHSIDETGTARHFIRRGIAADGPADLQMFTIEYNSTMFTFSKTSTQDSPILTSRVVINSVNDNLNGTVVICVDITSPRMESSSTTILIINREIQCMWTVIKVRSFH